MKLSSYTSELLCDIERRISEEIEDDYIRQWEDFWEGRTSEVIFRPRRKASAPPSVEVKRFNINDCISEPELMLDMQLAGVSDALKNGQGALAMRANYGTGIMSSIFGAEIFTMPRQTNTLPTTKAFDDDDRIRQIADSAAPSVLSGFGRQVFDFGEMCLEVLRDYPKISRYVYMYHPDTQGPLDIAELLWGADMFYAMYDEPELVHALMERICESYKKFLDKWFLMYPNRETLNAHWGFLMKGNICIRNDSAMNLSPDFYREFAFNYDNSLLDYYNGGIVHFCGRGDHYIDILSQSERLTGINLSQPHLNDMDKIYSSLFPRGKRIVGLRSDACEEYEGRENPYRGMICLA